MPLSAPRSRTGVRAYGLAVLTTIAGVVVTRVTWPLFAGTPFAPLFAAVAATSHWGSGPAGLVAVLLAVAGAILAFPADGAFPWDPRTLITFVPVAVFASQIIAGRNRTATALRESEAQLRATWEHATFGTALLNRFGYVERINPALERLLGYSAAACAGMRFADFSHPDEAAEERRRFDALVGGTESFYQREQRCQRRDGTVLSGRVTVSAIRGAGGVATGALAVLEDITAQREAEIELRESEQTLQRAQRVEAVARLVAGVAHNFNNLLTVIMGYTDVLLDRHGAQDPDRNEIQEIRKATDRGAVLTRQLLAFGRKHDAQLATVDLNHAVAGLGGMLARVLRDDIELAIHVASAPATVLIDPHDLEQVIVNLVLNARDALPQGGTIHIDVGRESIDATHGHPDAAAAPGEYVRLRVADDGIGMTPEVRSHLFEPFFTTKEVGQGTGLGLAFVQGIARANRGFVTVDTAPARGTTVSVYFTLASGAEESYALNTDRGNHGDGDHR
jgi:two-component system cell cycle sensor histidine kinase/response regulator CckA